MKQFVLLKNVALATDVTHISDLTGLTDGALAIFDAAAGTLKSLASASVTAALTKDFFITKGAASGKPVTDILCNKDFTASKSQFSAGANKIATLVVPTPVIGEEYTIILTKKGKKFNERMNWTACFTAASTTAADVALGLKNALALMVDSHNVTVTVSTATITFTGNDFEDFEITNDFGGTYAVTTNFAAPTNDKTAIKELFRSCIGSRGFEYTKDEKEEMYPEYANIVAQIESNTGYTVYSLRFANDRKVKTGANDVYQVVHLVVVEKTTNASTTASNYTAITGTLDKLFGLN